MIIALPDVNVDSHRGIVPTYGLCISHVDQSEGGNTFSRMSRSSSSSSGARSISCG